MRDLSKCIDMEDSSYYQQMFEVVNHVKHTTSYGVEMKRLPTLVWNLKFYADSDFSGDSQNRKSVSGYIIYLNENLTSWG